MLLKNRLSPHLLDACNSFFLGWGFPAFIAAFVVIGYVTGFELYMFLIYSLVLGFGMLATESVIPFVPVAAMFIFQISMKNCPETHVGSLYYHNPWIISAIVAVFALNATIAFYVMVKTGRLTWESIKSLPIPYAIAALTLGFLMNGAFSANWSLADTAYGVMMLAAYVFLFYVFFLGFKNEPADRLIEYMIYTAVFMALVLSAETVHLYLTNDKLFNNGEVVKEQVVYGWGMWTMAGQYLAVTIPLCFLGVMRGRLKWFCFASATLAFISAIMTLSRNSLLVAAAAYGICAIACCFIGKARREFRIIVPVGILAVALFAVIFRGKIFTLLSDYIERGFSDNGRFELWAHGIKSFLDAPLFGGGFFGIQRELVQGCTEGFSFYPRMMHNTPIQLLASMGIFGFVCYGYYRFKTVIPFVKKPSLEKTMLGATLLVVIVASLIDNFLFLIKNMIFYPIVLSVVFRLYADETENT